MLKPHGFTSWINKKNSPLSFRGSSYNLGVKNGEMLLGETSSSKSAFVDFFQEHQSKQTSLSTESFDTVGTERGAEALGR